MYVFAYIRDKRYVREIILWYRYEKELTDAITQPPTTQHLQADIHIWRMLISLPRALKHPLAVAASPLPFLPRGSGCRDRKKVA